MVMSYSGQSVSVVAAADVELVSAVEAAAELLVASLPEEQLASSASARDSANATDANFFIIFPPFCHPDRPDV